MNGGPTQPGGYDAAHFRDLVAVEDRHFWFTARNRVIAAVVRDAVRDLPPGYRVLEVGCGTGNVLRVLERVCRDGRVVGAELHAEGLAIARQRVGCALVQTDIRRFAFDEPFDLVGAFDVIEHLDDDAAALAALYRATRPGGALLVTVPASMALWSYFDEAAGHCRRYEPRTLYDVLTGAGFEVEYLTPFMAAIAPLLWLGRRINRGGDRADRARRELRIVPGVNALLDALLAMELPAVGWRRRLLFGSSLLAVARRPPSDSPDAPR